MDVIAIDSTGVLPQVTLGAVAQQIWVNGFKDAEERKLQPVQPINAPAPTIVDRIMTMEDFWVAAGRSFIGPFPVSQALYFMGTHKKMVPRLANLQFIEKADGGNQVIWLRGCGIQQVELVEKKAAYIAYGYKIIGGAWSLT
jgi:hypothetical protein